MALGMARMDWAERALRLLLPGVRDDAAAVSARCQRLEGLLQSTAVATTACDDSLGSPPHHDAGLAAWREHAGRLHARSVSRLSRVHAVQAVFARNLRLFESVETAVASFAGREEAEKALVSAWAQCQRLAVELPPEPEPIRVLPAAGYVGLTMRGDLPISLAEAAFMPGEVRVTGPVRHAGRFWLVERLMPPTPVMNDGTYEWCEDLRVEDAMEALTNRG